MRTIMGLSERINRETDSLGGFLRCETCLRVEALGNVGERTTATGWPKCCGYTMRWWTRRQIENGELRRATPR